MPRFKIGQKIILNKNLSNDPETWPRYELGWMYTPLDWRKLRGKKAEVIRSRTRGRVIAQFEDGNRGEFHERWFFPIDPIPLKLFIKGM